MAEDSAGLKPKFLAVWQQLAARYQNTSENVLFEILNEPNKNLTPDLWNDYLKEPLEIIRAANPIRTNWITLTYIQPTRSHPKMSTL